MLSQQRSPVKAPARLCIVVNGFSFSIILLTVLGLVALTGIKDHLHGVRWRLHARGRAGLRALGYKPIPHDFLLRAQSLHGGIPMVVHQSWKNDTVPDSFNKSWLLSWKEQNPGWLYHLWTDEDNRQLVKQHYPWFLPTYDAFPKPVMRADAVRFCYMHRYGGVYADLDFECLQPMGQLLQHLPGAVVGRMGEKDFPHCLPNAWMASAPGNDFWIFSLQMIAKTAQMESESPEWVTGPALLYRAVHAWYNVHWLTDTVNVTGDTQLANMTHPHTVLHVLPPAAVFPVNWDDPERPEFCIPDSGIFDGDQCKATLEGAFAVTYWTHSWEVGPWLLDAAPGDSAEQEGTEDEQGEVQTVRAAEHRRFKIRGHSNATAEDGSEHRHDAGGEQNSQMTRGLEDNGVPAVATQDSSSQLDGRKDSGGHMAGKSSDTAGREGGNTLGSKQQQQSQKR